jgi:hypothetical protein
MSALLFVVGAIAAMVGVGMVGYGISINESSLGNTLIVEGTTATLGGLIVIGIGAAVGQLQRISETLVTRTSVRSSRSLEMFEPPAGSHTAPMRVQIPFPPRPKSKTSIRKPQPSTDAPPPADIPIEDRAATAVPPTLRDLDMPAVVIEEGEIKEYEEISLSPQQLMPMPSDLGEPAPPPPVSADASPVAEKHLESAFDAPWQSSPPPESQARQPQKSYFDDAMWPAESRPVKRPVIDETKPELPPVNTTAAPEAHKPHPVSEPPVEILKSGVIDGMGYTLYVDGSIDAELPQGPLRFASINDLRSHLEKSS